jgi:perosamine synthetase
MIRVFEPEITKEDINSVLKTLKNKDISGSSEIVKEFEDSLCNEFSRKYVVSVSNGSVALDMSIQLLNLEEGDEVILPSHTIISCLSAVIRSKAKPVFCDVDPKSWNMTAQNVKEVITSKTKAVLLVHTYGLPAEAEKIIELCLSHNITVIEDAAEAHGQYESNKKCGSFGLISTLSFYANKHITAGEGGALLTDSRTIYEEALKMRNLDFTAEQRFKTEKLYWNYRLGGLQAALGNSQIKNLKKTITSKTSQGKVYQKLLSKYTNMFTLPLEEYNGIRNHYWVFGIVLKKDNIRDRVMKDLYDLGVETRPFFWPLHLQPSLPNNFKDQNSNLTVSEHIGKNGLYIPLGSHINKKLQTKVVTNLVDTLHKYF